MGNSLLDVIVFGRDAGKAAAAKAKDVTLGKMNLDHVEKYAEILKEAGIDTGMVSPQLLPNYAGKSRFRDTLSVLKSKRFFGTINHRSKERWRTPCVKFRLVPLRMW